MTTMIKAQQAGIAKFVEDSHGFYTLRGQDELERDGVYPDAGWIQGGWDPEFFCMVEDATGMQVMLIDFGHRGALAQLVDGKVSMDAGYDVACEVPGLNCVAALVNLRGV